MGCCAFPLGMNSTLRYDRFQQTDNVGSSFTIGAPDELLAGRSLFFDGFLGVLVLRRGRLPLWLQPTGQQKIVRVQGIFR
jgi:hypothetical protein